MKVYTVGCGVCGACGSILYATPRLFVTRLYIDRSIEAGAGLSELRLRESHSQLVPYISCMCMVLNSSFKGGRGHRDISASVTWCALGETALSRRALRLFKLQCAFDSCANLRWRQQAPQPPTMPQLPARAAAPILPFLPTHKEFQPLSTPPRNPQASPPPPRQRHASPSF